ncbi:MAG: RagB/SusD family nutrient uptake outer membrane protein [Bacteroidales bacterium]
MIAVLVLTLSACDTDLSMTSTKPNLQEPSEALMKGMLTTAYSALTTDRSGYGQALWGAVNGCDTDESFFKNTNNADLTTVGLHNCNSTNTTYIQESWRTFYEMIESCNIVIEMAKSVNMDNAKKADIVGQAMTLRAFAHFMLAVHYGPVPIRNIPVHLMGNLDLPRNSVKEVCAFSVKELRDAVPMLNEITTTQTTTYITKSVAEGLSLRVGLFMASHPDIKDVAKYDSVAVWGKQLIDRGVHQLNTNTFPLKGASGNSDVLPGYAKVFVSNMMNIVSTSSNPEGMWDCSFYMKSNSATSQNPYQSWNGGYQNYLGSYMGLDCEDPSYGTSKIGYSKAYYRPQHTLWAKYEPGDVRRDWNISPYLYKNSNGARYYYINCKLPATMGAVTDTAKLQFIVKGDKLVDATVIEKGGSGYTDGSYTLTVSGYGAGWSASTVSVSTGAGTKFTVTVSGGTVTNVKMVGTSASGYLNVYTRGIGKWRREYELNPTAPREQYNTSCNFPILRYADVLLMTAEAALMKTGGSGATVAEGVGYLNQLRGRAGLSAPISSYDLSYIQDERSRELCFEGVRRMDLMRWGFDKYKAVYDKIVDDVKVYGSDGAATPVYKGDAGVNSVANFEPRPVYAIKALMGNYVKFSLMPIPNNEIGRASNTFYQNQGW